MKKKLRMVLMVTMLLLFTMPFNVKASETEPSGTCGPNLTWRITDHGYLLIQGEGKMDDFSLIANQPWADYRDQITNVALDQGVSSIGENAFANCFSLEKVSMGDNVLSIGYSAFRQCKSLTHVILSKNLVSIDKSAFELCESLFSIVETNEEGAFGIGGITIPARVESIGEWAFAHCESIESVEFAWDAGVQLDVGTFLDCYSLKSVKLPDTLAELPATTFMNDSALENLVIPDSVTYIGVNAASYCTSLKSIVIPESVTEIDDAAFEGDSQLASVTIPENLTMINGTAFSDTPWIRAMGDYPVVNGVLLQYQGSDANVVIPGNVKRIGSASFYQNTKITSVTISPGVEVIGAHAFAFCSNLKTVSIPDSVISIGEEAFTSCRGLESITLPSGVKTLGVGLFSDCSLLKELTIPSGIEEIPNMMLYSCRGLVSVSIPLSVKTIGNSVFNLCMSLTDIYYEGSKSDWSKIRKGNYNPQLSSAVIHYGKEDNVPVTGVEMSVASAEMITSKTTSTTPYTITQASTLQLHATIKPENATNQDVTWSSSNPAVAVVDENGLVTALTYGKTTITVTTEDGKKTAAC